MKLEHCCVCIADNERGAIDKTPQHGLSTTAPDALAEEPSAPHA